MARADDPLNQQLVPPSFVALYVPDGLVRASLDRQALAERHEFCEDLAQMLTDTARDQWHAMHITEADVLQRIHAGLLTSDVLNGPPEAGWVIGRLAELLQWPQPATDDNPAPI
jgi:hypothetical protein